jgi:1-phosphofructokinase
MYAASAYFVLSGSLPRNLSGDTYLTLCRRLQAIGARVFVDADGGPFAQAMEAPPDYIKPNRYELLQYFHHPAANDDGVAVSDKELAAMCRELLGRGVKMVMLSLGKDGAMFACSGGIWRAAALPATVRSTVGAGDSMVAAAAYALEQGRQLEQCFISAMAASAAAVTTEGTKPPPRSLVEKLKSQVVLEKMND